MIDTSVITDEDRLLLRALFIANESSSGRPTAHAFRMRHKNALNRINGLLGRFIKPEREYYRLTLDGLYACDLARDYIASFNEILPTLSSMYEERGPSQWAIADLIQRAQRDPRLMINEQPLRRALWYIIPDLGPAITGWSADAVGELTSINLGEPIVTLSPLPLTKTFNDLPNSPAKELREPTEAEKERTMSKDPRNVFVVHGRNLDARDAVFDLLRSVGLNPMEWEEARRLTDKASPYIGEILGAAFANAQAIVVLLTGDDEARLREELRGGSEPPHEVDLTPQARPNVLFEAGMALGSHPDQTLLIEIGDLRPFSDAAGRHTVRLKAGGAGERQSIVERLKSAGCAVVTEGRRDWLERPFFAKVLGGSPTSSGARARGSSTALSSLFETPPEEFPPDVKPKRKAITRIDQIERMEPPQPLGHGVPKPRK